MRGCVQKLSGTLGGAVRVEPGLRGCIACGSAGRVIYLSLFTTNDVAQSITALSFAWFTAAAGSTFFGHTSEHSFAYEHEKTVPSPRKISLRSCEPSSRESML